MNDFNYGWAVGYGGPGAIVMVHVFGGTGQTTLGLSPENAEAMATALLMAAKERRESWESKDEGGDDD
jgi:hypothetical protein